MTMDNAQVTGLGDLGQYIQHKHNCTLGMRMGKECECGLTDTLALHRLERSEPVAFQQGVDQWMDVCFGEAIKADRVERCDRFIEEALEFVQSVGYSAERAHALVDYVFNRDIGEVNQEVGGVMVTLAAACNTVGVDMQKAAETELARVWTKVEAIRAKQAAKPTGSALPVATTPPEPVAEIERLREALWTPGEKAWAGLARDLMMAFDMGCRTPREIFQHLDRCGKPIPQWLRDEGEMRHLDHVPSKGTRAMIIYRAMLEPALAALGEAS